MISLSAFWEGAAQRIDRAVFQEDSRTLGRAVAETRQKNRILGLARLIVTCRLQRVDVN